MEISLTHDIKSENNSCITLITKIKDGKIVDQDFQGYAVELTPEVLRNIADDLEKLTTTKPKAVYRSNKNAEPNPFNRYNPCIKPEREINYNEDQ